MNTACCFSGCTGRGTASLRLTFHLPREEDSEVILWAHEECFSRLCDPSVMADDPKEHGHIPAKVRCVFCGAALPVFGKHPYCFDVGDCSPPHRFWSHAQCMAQRLDTKSMASL